MIDVPWAQVEGYEFFWAPKRAILCPGNKAGVLPVKFIMGDVHLDSGEQMKLESPIVQTVLTHDTLQGDPGGEGQGEAYGLRTKILAPLKTPAKRRELNTIDTALGSDEETHNSGDSSSEGEAETTLVDEGSDCEIVTLCQLRSGTVVPIKVQGQSLFAVVDIAAEVTLISEEVYRSLKSAPPVLREVIMNTAGKGMQMNGYVVGPVNLELGSKLIQSNLYVAPIEDDILLGFDLLRAHCIDLQMSEGQLWVGYEAIPMTMGKVGQAPRVANVTLREKITVPPNSVMKISCYVNWVLPSYIVEAGTHSGLLVPCTLHAGGANP
ncbi:unnamed protein product [Mytilus coruscus]|uniref:Peptidase A2 domain-containing protein n=1 Tax=Mytilus coruscus TaxID=42192 RepID=A0A6J8BYN5_MYTCO|nr:unnamed protein product [Mytilus coruscus]